MSSRQLIACKYCKRDNFRSQSGLQMHLRFSKTCSPQALADKENLVELGDPNPWVNGVQVGDTFMESGDEYDSDDDSDAGMMVVEHDDFDPDYPDLPALLRPLPKKVIEFQDDDDWGVGGYSDEEDIDDGDPSRKRLRQFRQYVRMVRDDMLPFTKKEEAAIELMDTLRRKKATLDTYDNVMEWHLRQTNNMGDAEPYNPSVGTAGFHTRQVMMKKLARRYNKEVNLFRERKIVLPSSGAKVNLIHYDFRDKLVSLLTDPRLTDDDFLHFNDDPFAPPPPDLDYIGDVNTGLAYKAAYKELITKPGQQILVPIIWYIDGCVTGQFDKCNVEALKFSLGILTNQARDKPFAWETAGYVPNYSKSDSRGKKLLQITNHAAAHLLPVDDDEGMDEEADTESEGSGGEYDPESGITEKMNYTDSKAQDWHRVLSALLNSYRKMAKEGFRWDYKYRGKLYKDVELVFFTMFVKCDGDEADKLCGHYRSRGEKVASICRYCTIPTSLLDSHELPKTVKMKTVEMIQDLLDDEDDEGLKKISQQFIKNCWYDVQFGPHNGMGIHGACPMELLHHILLGIFKYIRDAFLNQIGSSSKNADEINALAKVLGRFFARQSDRDLPKTNFSKGIFEGKIMGKEFSGVLLLIAAILQTDLGQTLLKKRKANFGKQWLIDDWALLVETLLQWEAFLKSDEMDRKHVQRLEKKHSFIMFLIKKISNRTQGMAFKIMKYHGILHLYQDILNFGVPKCVDTGANESHHKPTKYAAKLTQRDILVFEKQTARRVDEFHLLDLAVCELEGKRVYEYFCLDQVRGVPSDDKQDESFSDQVKTYGTQIQVFWDDDVDEIAWRYAKNNNTAGWESSITDYLFGLQEVMQFSVGLERLDIRTEHKRKGQIFRAHPDFKKRGQWNDWATFDWGTHGRLPAEIWCFVDFSGLPDNFSGKYAHSCFQKGVYAVVESAHFDCNPGGSPNTKSELFVPLIKEVESIDQDGNIHQRRFYLADVEAIVAPLCVVPDIGEHKFRYLQLKPRKQWAGQFADWLMRPYKDDMAEMHEEESSDDE